MLLAANLDPVVDCGTINATWTDLAHRIQEQAGAPPVLIDGSFARLPREIRAMADLLAVPGRGEELGRCHFKQCSLEAAVALLPALLDEVDVLT